MIRELVVCAALSSSLAAVLAAQGCKSSICPSPAASDAGSLPVCTRFQLFSGCRSDDDCKKFYETFAPPGVEVVAHCASGVGCLAGDECSPDDLGSVTQCSCGDAHCSDAEVCVGGCGKAYCLPVCRK